MVSADEAKAIAWRSSSALMAAGEAAAGGGVVVEEEEEEGRRSHWTPKSKVSKPNFTSFGEVFGGAEAAIGDVVWMPMSVAIFFTSGTGASRAGAGVETTAGTGSA